MKHDVSLPDDWIWTTVGDIAERVTKGSTPTSYGFRYHQQGIRFVKTENIWDDGTIHNITDFIDDETNRFLSRSILQPNDILFSIAGTIGRVGIVQDKDVPANTNQALAILRGIHKQAYSKYVFYYLKSPFIQKQALKSIVGVGRANVSLANVSSFRIPLPPLPEQERIVARIESLFTQLEAGVEALKRVRAALKRYKASVLKAACEGRLVAQDAGDESAEVLLRRILAEKGEVYRAPEGELGELPRGWVWVTTGTLCDCIVPNRDKPKSFNGDIPWVTLPDFNGSIEIRESKKNLGLSKEEAYKYRARIIPEGSVVMSCIGRFGITAIAARDIVINQQLHAFLIRKDYLDSRYLAYAIRTQIPYMEKKATATTIAYLNKENCNSLPIPYPPLAEQCRIVAEVERRLSVVQEMEGTIEANLRRAGRLRQAVLKRAFEGRLG